MRPFVPVVLLALGAAAAAVYAGQGFEDSAKAKLGKGALFSSPDRKDKVRLTEAEWKKKLAPVNYDILRKDGTEAAYKNKYFDNHQAGDYVCAGCGLPLFSSDTKFESGTGWPSFYKPVAADAVWYKRDTTLGTVRVEVRCARCDGHLGHVFDDADDQPTGLRYCMNSGALKFIKASASKKK